MSNPPLLTPASALRVVLKYLPAYLRVSTDLTTKVVSEVWRGITTFRWFSVLDALIAYFSTVPFTPIIAFVRALSLELAENAKFYRRYVITGEEVVRYFATVTEEVFKFTGNIGNDTITAVVIQWGARLSWNIITGHTYLAKVFKLIKIKTYDDLYQIYKSGALRRLWMIIIQLAVVWFALSTAMATLIWLGLNFHKTFNPLSQLSPRVRFPKNKPRHRERNLNGKRGGGKTGP